MNSLAIKNIALYQFFKPTFDLAEARLKLRNAMRELRIKGTLLLSQEGLNGSLAGNAAEVDAFINLLSETIGIPNPVLKISYSEKMPFTRALVKVKPHIVAEPGETPIDLSKDSAPHLAPETLHRWIKEGKEMVILDTRNDYEYQVGKFKDSLHLGTQHFSDFEKDLEKTPLKWKDTPIVTFCTGGIRCEKAAPLMIKKGFREVYQLDGGILNYFEKVGRGYFEGGCFVFDQRVALDDKLAPTGDAMCFNCQAILSIEEQKSPHYKAPTHCPHCYQEKPQKRNHRSNPIPEM